MNAVQRHAFRAFLATLSPMQARVLLDIVGSRAENDRVAAERGDEVEAVDFVEDLNHEVSKAWAAGA